MRTMRTVKAISISMLIGMQLGAVPARSAIPNHVRTWMVLTPVRNFSKGLNALAIQPVASLRTVTEADVEKIIPHRELAAGSSGALVATQILDHSLSSFFNSPEVRNSDFGKTAKEVEQSMEGEAAFGGEEKGSTRHVFKFAMRAAQAKAELEYSGLTNAQLSYIVSQSKMNLEVHEDLSLGTKVVFNHIDSPGDRTDMLSVRWKW